MQINSRLKLIFYRLLLMGVVLGILALELMAFYSGQAIIFLAGILLCVLNVVVLAIWTAR